MKTYYDNVMSMESLSLFTEYARKEGKEEGFEIGEKRGLEIGKKRGFKIGKKEGFKIGKKEGIEIATAKLVLNAAGRGIPVEKIAGIMELTVEQVRTILQNGQKSDA
ncbi:MAG: hypothetical protein LBC47_09910 [Tannerella sp.]|jgi:hypothetical protein|nr:hypothetical protein [Tannerella sp.]